MIKVTQHWSTILKFMVNCRVKAANWLTTHAECEICFAPACEAGFLCRSCWQTLPRAVFACSQCAEPMHSPGRCNRCLSQPPAMDYAICSYLYEPPLSLWLQQLKDQHQLQRLPRLLWLMTHQAPEFTGVDGIAYIPSPRRKLWRRGFNPAELLARRIAAQRHLPVLSQALHTQTQQDQRGLNRRQRLQNSRKALRPGGQNLQGRHILLIEDVITTGATADAAARALKQQGAAIVGIWALARTPKASD